MTFVSALSMPLLAVNRALRLDPMVLIRSLDLRRSANPSPPPWLPERKNAALVAVGVLPRWAGNGERGPFPGLEGPSASLTWELLDRWKASDLGWLKVEQASRTKVNVTRRGGRVKSAW